MNITLTPTGMESRTWNGVKIQRRPTDGYVNATAMCKAYGRQWSHYMENARTSQYLQALSTSLGIPRDLLIQSITTGANELRGTWVHPRLAIDLARWLHPEFAVWMDGWFLESFTERGIHPMVAANPTPAPAPMPRKPEVWEVGGPGVNVPGAPAFSAQLTQILDAYTAHVEARFLAHAAAVQAQHGLWPRYKSPRNATKCFLEWFAINYGHLMLSPAPVESPIRAVTAPARPVALPTAPAAAPPLRQLMQDANAYRSGDLITGPELAHILGLDARTINRWAAARRIGAVRDGWRLMGRGKPSAGKACGVYPPGCASWLFMKL